MTKTIPIKKPRYEPRCATCRYMRKNREFKERILLSTYVRADGSETVDDVLKDFGNPIPRSTVYRHLERHQGIVRATAKDAEIAKANQAVVEVLRNEIKSNPDAPPHEQFIDGVINEGIELLAEGKLGLSTSQLLAAAKIKTDIEAKRKDQKLDALKLFVGAAPKKDKDV